MDHLEYQRHWNDDATVLWHRWNDWTPLAEASPPVESGVYLLSVRRGSRPRTIRRLLGSDRQGALDIGESSDLSTRIYNLRRCAFADRKTGHMAGWRYRYLALHEKLRGTLMVSWKTGPQSYQLEAETMAAYLNAFGELPPLNYKANWKLLRADLGEIVADR
jgi:hypothetical protein